MNKATLLSLFFMVLSLTVFGQTTTTKSLSSTQFLTCFNKGLMTINNYLKLASIKDLTAYYWLEQNLGISLNPEQWNHHTIDLSNYTGKLDTAVKTELQADNWLGNRQLNSIEIDTNGIIVDLSEDGLIKTLILLEDYFILSYHLMLGSSGESLIYSFDSHSFYIDQELIVTKINTPTEVTVGKDYYDPRDVEDPNYQGHIFELGTYNLITRAYTFKQYE